MQPCMRFVNGTLHGPTTRVVSLACGLTVVVEEPKMDAVKITIYRGDDPEPISVEWYSATS